MFAVPPTCERCRGHLTGDLRQSPCDECDMCNAIQRLRLKYRDRCAGVISHRFAPAARAADIAVSAGSPGRTQRGVVRDYRGRPGATSVNPPSVTTGRPLASSSVHCPRSGPDRQVKINRPPGANGCQVTAPTRPAGPRARPAPWPSPRSSAAPG